MNGFGGFNFGGQDGCGCDNCLLLLLMLVCCCGCNICDILPLILILNCCCGKKDKCDYNTCN